MRSFRFGDAPRASIPRGAEPAHGSTPSYATGALNILRGEVRTDLVDDFEPMGLASEEENAEHLVAGCPKPARCAAALKGSNRRAVRPSCSPMCMG